MPRCGRGSAARAGKACPDTRAKIAAGRRSDALAWQNCGPSGFSISFPLPLRRGGCKHSRSRGASASEFGNSIAQAPESRGSEAPKGALSLRAVPATARQRTLRRCARLSALHHGSTAQRDCRRLVSAQGRASWDGGLTRAAPRSPSSSTASSSQTGPNAGRAGSRAARERSANPPAGTVPAPPTGPPPEGAPR
jgi:hypothetical protein